MRIVNPSAGIVSPAFTGDPTAPTAITPDNDTSVATTAFTKAAIAAAIGVTVQAWDADLDALAAYSDAASAGPAELPCGRLTLQTAVPVMVSTQSAKTTIYYTPYQGNRVPIYDGTNWKNFAFAELSNATAQSSTGSAGPAAVANTSVYDLFVWNNAGVLTLTRGPLWTNDTARSAGTALTLVNGILLNNATITNGPAASRGTYVGTVRSNGSAQIDWILGASAAGGTAAFLGVWNAYNRVNIATTVTDSNSPWTQTSATVGPADVGGTGSGLNNRITFVSGLAEDSVRGSYVDTFAAAGVLAAEADIGLALDSTTAFDKRAAILGNTVSAATTAPGHVETLYQPQLGVHYLQALNSSDGTHSSTFYGGALQGLSAQLRM